MSDNLCAIPASSNSPKLLDRARAWLRLKHYSIRTEAAYISRIHRIVRFHGKNFLDGLAFLPQANVRYVTAEGRLLAGC